MAPPSLTIETPATFIVRPGPVTVALVGCGGTGSHLAQALARIAVHVRAGGDPPRLIFIDGDTVEEKNVGRQLFTPADVGHNKAQVLAERFGRLFGLRIDAVPEMATVDLLRGLWPRNDPYQYEKVGILVGAVDNAVARKSLAGALNNGRWLMWLDCGNHEDSGQVSIGTHTDPVLLREPIKAGLCTRLPAPSLIDPEILAATPPRRRADCAAAMEDNLQGLMVNTQVAAIAAVYLERLIIRRQLQTFRTSFTQAGLSMRSLPITPTAIAEVLRPHQPAAPATKKKGRAA